MNYRRLFALSLSSVLATACTSLIGLPSLEPGGDAATDSGVVDGGALGDAAPSDGALDSTSRDAMNDSSMDAADAVVDSSTNVDAADGAADSARNVDAADASSDASNDTGARDAVADASSDAAVTDAALDSAGDAALCETGTASCSSATPETCVAGQWVLSDAGPCAIGCSSGLCQVCSPGMGYCAISMDDAGPTYELCSADGLSQDATACSASCFSSQGCVACVPGTASCDSNGTLTLCGDGGLPTTNVCGAPYKCDAVDQKCIASPVKAIALGMGLASVNCAVGSDNNVYCWGNRPSGLKFAVPTLVDGGAGAVKAAMGGRVGCAVMQGGSLSCWPQIDAPAAPVSGLTDIVDVAIGSGVAANFTCALHDAGTVSCWGEGTYGELGDSKGTTESAPVTVAGISNAVQIAVARNSGGNVACARLSGGTVSCWGGGVKSPVNLGVTSATNLVVGGGGPDGTILVVEDGGVTVYSLVAGDGGGFSTPVAYSTSIPNAVSLSADTTLYVVTSDGGVLSAALGATSPGTLAPVAIAPSSNAVEIETAIYGAGNGNGCYLTSDGRVFCWGDDGESEFGDGYPWYRTIAAQLPGIDSAVEVSPAGWSGSSLLTTSSSVWVWGAEGEGASGTWLGTSGTPTPVAAASPYATNIRRVRGAYEYGNVLIQQSSGQIILDTRYHSFGSIPGTSWVAGANIGLNNLGISDWTDVAVGTGGGSVGTIDFEMGFSPSHGVVVYAQTANSDTYGIFGNGTYAAVLDASVTVPGTSDAVGVAFADPNAGGNHACSWDSDGGALCWGTDQFTNTAAAPPFKDGASHHVAFIAVSQNTCVVADEGDVYCGGTVNGSGELGYDAGSSSPLLEKVNGVGNAVGVTTASGASCAWLRDTTAMCWGDNSSGRLGDGTQVSRSNPAPVLGLTNVQAMGVAGNRTCAVHGDGRVSCWGWDGLGDTGTVTASQWAYPSSARNAVGFGPP